MFSRFQPPRNRCSSPRLPHFFRRISGAAPAALALIVAAGPAPAQPGDKTKVDPKAAQQGKDVFKSKPDGKAGPKDRKDAPDNDHLWSILIVAYPDDSDMAAANVALERVRAETGISDAYAEIRGKNSVVCVGRYADPSSKEARRDLERVRAIDWKGVKPFAAALLVPPVYDAISGSIPELDLRAVRQRVGKDALYTLEIAHYERPDRRPPSEKELREFREAAERAAVVLRREGDEAFYCHLPDRSVVTVGVFGADDYIATKTSSQGTVRTITPRESAKVQALRQRFPNLLINGQGARAKVTGMDKAQDLRPVVVEIPDAGAP